MPVILWPGAIVVVVQTPWVAGPSAIVALGISTGQETLLKLAAYKTHYSTVN